MEFTAIVKAISGALWDNILLVLLCCTGIYFTLRLRFVQIVKFKDSFKKVFGGFRVDDRHRCANRYRQYRRRSHSCGFRRPRRYLLDVDQRFFWHGNDLFRGHTCAKI